MNLHVESNRNMDSQSIEDTIPEGLKYDSSLPLYSITKREEFEPWLLTLICHLYSHDLIHIVSADRSPTPHSITDGEELGLERLFNHYVKKSAWPRWMETPVLIGISKSSLLISAIREYYNENAPYDIIEKLRTMNYKGDTPAKKYVTEIKELIKPITSYDNKVLCTIVRETILGNLIGPFEAVTQKIHRQLPEYTIDDILDYIVQYDEERGPKSVGNSLEDSKKIGGRQPKKFCTTCDSSTHSTSKCPRTHSSTTELTLSTKTKAASSKKSNQKGKKSKKSNKHCNHPKAPEQKLDKQESDQATLTSPIDASYHSMIVCTREITIVRHEYFLHDRTYPKDVTIQSNFGSSADVLCKGTLRLRLLNDTIVSMEAYCVPSCRYNIVSQMELLRQGIYVDGIRRRLKNSDGNVVANLIQSNDLDRISTRLVQLPSDIPKHLRSTIQEKYPLNMIHKLFGHIDVNDIKKSLQMKTFTGLDHDDVDWTHISTFQCDHCLLGRSPYKNTISGEQNNNLAKYKAFEYIHCDIFGPLGIKNIVDKYFITFIDENTHLHLIYSLEDRSEKCIITVLDGLADHFARRFHGKILCFQFGQGSEYATSAVSAHLKRKGINLTDTTEANSRAHQVAERLNLTLFNDARTILLASGLPETIWYLAVQYSASIRNATYDDILRASPRSKAGLRGHDSTTILAFGQKVVIESYLNGSNVVPRVDQGMAVCPSAHDHGHYIYIPDTHEVVESTNFAVYEKNVAIHPNEIGYSSFLDSIIEDIAPKNTVIMVDYFTPSDKV